MLRRLPAALLLLVVLIAIIPVTGRGAGLVGAAGPASSPASASASAPPTTTPAGPATDDSIVNDFVPDRDLDDCISALPQPDCGSTARSGWRQWVIFGLLAAAIAFIAWRIIRSARRGRPTDDA
ncbi:MAG: hypothetical protein ABW328_08875 [Ilumatobacteraceae bacterium]